MENTVMLPAEEIQEASIDEANAATTEDLQNLSNEPLPFASSDVSQVHTIVSLKFDELRTKVTESGQKADQARTSAQNAKEKSAGLFQKKMQLSLFKLQKLILLMHR